MPIIGMCKEQLVDDVLFTYFARPNSLHRARIALEISCHGNPSSRKKFWKTC